MPLAPCFDALTCLFLIRVYPRSSAASFSRGFVLKVVIYRVFAPSGSLTHVWIDDSTNGVGPFLFQASEASQKGDAGGNFNLVQLVDQYS